MKLLLLASLLALTSALAACGGAKQRSPLATAFNQNLTDAARSVSTLPTDVEQIQCWAEKHFVGDDQVFCNVYLRGRAPRDIGQKAIGWDIPVREPGRLDGVNGSEPRYLSPSQIDLALLSETGFVFVVKNVPQGLTVEVSANRDRVTLGQAENFIDTVLPVVSAEISKQLKEASAAAPDSIRATWSGK